MLNRRAVYRRGKGKAQLRADAFATWRSVRFGSMEKF